MAPCFAGALAVGLIERLPDRGGDHGVLALRHMGEGVAHPVHTAALPGSVEDTGYGGLEADVRIGDHQLHATQPAALEAAQGHCQRKILNT